MRFNSSTSGASWTINHEGDVAYTRSSRSNRSTTTATTPGSTPASAWWLRKPRGWSCGSTARRRTALRGGEERL